MKTEAAWSDVIAQGKPQYIFSFYAARAETWFLVGVFHHKILHLCQQHEHWRHTHLCVCVCVCVCMCVCVFVLHTININNSSHVLSLCLPFYFYFASIHQLPSLCMIILIPVSDLPICSTSSVPIYASTTLMHLPPLRRYQCHHCPIWQIRLLTYLCLFVAVTP